MANALASGVSSAFEYGTHGPLLKVDKTRFIQEAVDFHRSLAKEMDNWPASEMQKSGIAAQPTSVENFPSLKPRYRTL